MGSDKSPPPFQLDFDRERRCGYPEVIFGEGKTIEQLIEISGKLRDAGQNLLATRLSPEKQSALLQVLPDGVANPVARTFRWQKKSDTETEGVGKVAVISAGTGDLPVAEEACETLLWMGIRVTKIWDVGVAGPHRLPARLPEFVDSDAIIVAAGMEGALPSVVAGYVSCPVIAVPTSIGYGANFQGLSALLAMLNSCAANVAVVNIDAGFKAGYMAGIITSRAVT